MFRVTVMMFRDMVESVMLLKEDDCKTREAARKTLQPQQGQNGALGRACRENTTPGIKFML